LSFDSVRFLTFTDWIIGHTPFEISAPLSDGHASLLIKLTKPKAPSPPFDDREESLVSVRR
jgi:hypothetical protein